MKARRGPAAKDADAGGADPHDRQRGNWAVRPKPRRAQLSGGDSQEGAVLPADTWSATARGLMSKGRGSGHRETRDPVAEHRLPKLLHSIEEGGGLPPAAG